MIIRQYSTYFPLWLPVKRRQEIVGEFMRNHRVSRLASALTGESRDVIPWTYEPVSDLFAMLCAAARMSLPVLEQSDDDWQLRNAAVLVEIAQKRINDSHYRQARAYVSLGEFLSFSMQIEDMHKKSSRLRFKWIGVFGQIDIEALHTYVSSASHLYACLRNAFERRISDPRYVFATKRHCSPPCTLDDYQNMNSETMALVIDWLLNSHVDHWSFQGVRQPSFAYMSTPGSAQGHRSRGALLKPWIIGAMVKRDGDVYQQLQQITVDAVKQLQAGRAYIYRGWDESYAQAAFRQKDIPEPQRTQLLKLIEEQDALQGH